MARNLHRDIDLVHNETLPHYVIRHAIKHRDRIALIDGTNNYNIWTYTELVRSVKDLSSALYQNGMRKGDRVCIFAPNIPEYPILFHAVLFTGATVVTANPAFTVNELIYQLNDCQANYLVTIPGLVETVKAARKECSNLHTVYVVGQMSGYRTYQDLLQEGRTAPFPDHVHLDTKEDLALIAYSSGTTGLPKGVMITHFGLLALACQFSSPQVGLYRSHDTTVAFLPLYHFYGLATLMNASLVAGHTMIVMQQFKLQQYLQLIQQYKATFLFVVPPVAILLGKSELSGQYDLSSVRSVICSAAPLSADVIQLLQKRLAGVQDIRQAFGLTEMISMVGVKTKPHGSCGCLLPNVEGKVIDPISKKEVGPDQEGEVFLRGPQIMKGYLNRPKATADMIDKDGWLQTGDLGKYDREGNFFIVDRLKELIKYKGYQVAPAELEALLLTHPGIADVAVVGRPDSYAGELPMASVVLKPGVNITDSDVKQFVQEKVSDYKRLRGGVAFVDKIPKTPSGKILRRMLRQTLPKSNL